MEKFILFSVISAILGCAPSRNKDVQAPTEDHVEIKSPEPLPVAEIVALKDPAFGGRPQEGGGETLQGPQGVSPDSSPEASYSITGCLAEMSETVKYDKYASKSARAQDRVHVRRDGKRIVVTHDLSHACCLKGSVTAVVTGALVRIDEHLTGEACRCMCRSSIRTVVPLDFGEYSIEVQLTTSNTPVLVHKEQISIQPVRPR